MKKLLLLPFLCAALFAEDKSYRYEDPIVFQRAELDPKTGKTIHNGKLWLMEADGSHLKQITFGHTYDEHASMYADQEHVLYSEFNAPNLNVRAGARLVKLNIYSGERTIIGEKPSCALHHASLSPVDDLLAYHYDCGGRVSQWVNLGDDAYEIAMRATNGVRTSTGIIAMHEKNLGQTPREVSLIHIQGRGRDTTSRHITDDRALHRRAAISPDEKWVAWQSNAEGDGDEILMAKIDGSDRRNLTKAGGNDGHPWFSRDGKWIVFESDRSGAWEIWRIHLESGKQEQLTDAKGAYVSTRARM